MYTRHDKMEWLEQTCSKDFLNNHLLLELVNWMGEDDFDEFYTRLCGNWCIKREPNDPEYDLEYDNME